MAPTIDEILDFSINYLYGLFENTTDKKGVKQETLFEIETKLIEKYFPEIKFDPKNPTEEIVPLRRLFLPIYWHFLYNYSLQNQVEDGNKPPNDILYWKLKNSLPTKQEFKKDILEQKWVIPYLQSNLNNIYKTI